MIRSVATAAPWLVPVGASASVVNGLLVESNPFSHGQKSFSLFRIKCSQWSGTDVVKQVAVLDNVIDQEFDGGFDGFGCCVGCVGPVARPAGAGDIRHGHAAFPRRLSVEGA